MLLAVWGMRKGGRGLVGRPDREQVLKDGGSVLTK